MIAVLQRVRSASVLADGAPAGECAEGLLILLGVGKGDAEEDALLLADKIAKCRIFCDENDKMNLSVQDVGGEALVVSNFTLCADTSHGRRPSFTGAKPPREAEKLYELYMNCLKEQGVASVQAGRFGADMKVSIENDGPVTVILDTDIWEKSS